MATGAIDMFVPLASELEQRSIRDRQLRDPAERAAYSDRRRMSAQTLMDFPDWLRQHHPWMAKVPVVPIAAMQQLQQQFDRYRTTHLAASELDLRDESLGLRREELEQRQKELRFNRKQRRDGQAPKTLEQMAVSALGSGDDDSLAKIIQTRTQMMGGRTSTPPNSLEALLARTASEGGDVEPIMDLARRFSSSGGASQSPINTFEAGAARSMAAGDRKATRRFLRAGQKLKGKQEPGILDPDTDMGETQRAAVNEELLARVEKLDAPESGGWIRQARGPVKAMLEAADYVADNSRVMGKGWYKQAHAMLVERRPSPAQIGQAIKRGEITRAEAAKLLDMLYTPEERARILEGAGAQPAPPTGPPAPAAAGNAPGDWRFGPPGGGGLFNDN